MREPYENETFDFVQFSFVINGGINILGLNPQVEEFLASSPLVYLSF